MKATQLDNGQIELLLENQKEIDGFMAVYNEFGICEAVGWDTLPDDVFELLSECCSPQWNVYSERLGNLLDKATPEEVKETPPRRWAVSRTYLVNGETEIKVVSADTNLEAVAEAWGFLGDDWLDLEDSLNNIGIGIGTIRL